MADATLKPSSGDDLILSNDDGSKKIEVPESGDVEVTGDLKTTNVKATNLKANDGTASLEIADSTGDIGFSGNTNLKVKLPSSGGIFESDGSTEVLTESGGSVSLKNTTLDSTVTFPAGYSIFIKKQDRDGYGSVGKQDNWYPTTTTDLADKSFYLSITSSEHSPFSKLNINYTANFRINDQDHTTIDYRLVRWTGTGNIASETELIRGNCGSVTSDTEEYCCVSGSAIDDISSIGSVQINYSIQYRSLGGGTINAAEIYFGLNSDDKLQIHAMGII